MSEIRAGDKAPDVTLVNWDRQEVRLADLVGEPLVLAFFPAAFTGVCTREMCTFRDTLGQFQDVGARVVGISVDLPFSQKAFAEKHELPFPLMSDFNRHAVRAFGVEDPGFVKGLLPGVARRSVFVLDAEGTVVYAWVSENSSIEPNYDEVKEALGGLQAGGQAKAGPRKSP